MDLFARLRLGTLQAAQENELPDYLAERLHAIANSPNRYPDADDKILQLIEMLPLYDTYAQCGYIGMGVSNCILEGVIRQVESKLGCSAATVEKGSDLFAEKTEIMRFPTRK